MEYTKALEKQSFQKLIYSLRNIEDEEIKEIIDKGLEELTDDIGKLENGETYLIRMEDMFRLIDLCSYYEGVMDGAKLFKVLSE